MGRKKGDLFARISLDEWAESMDRPVSVGIREDVIGRPRLVPANKAFGGA